MNIIQTSKGLKTINLFGIGVNKKLVIFFTSATLLVFPIIVLKAATIDPTTWIQTILTRVLDWIVWPIFFAVSVIMFIVAGFLYVTARGEPGKIQTANKAILWAVVGIIIAILGFSATEIITSILGL